MKAKLTKRAIDGFFPKDKPFPIRDSEIPGFSLRVYPNGRKAFFYRYRVGGGRGAKIREPRIGDYGPLTTEQARNIAKDWTAIVHQGGDPMGDRQAHRDMPTMAELFARYLSDHAKRHKKDSSVRNDVRMMEKRLTPLLGKKQVNAVSRQEIKALHASLADTPYEANRTLALLSKVFNFASDELEWIKRSEHPVVGIKRYTEKKRKRYLSQTELARLGDALRKAEESQLDRLISPYAVAMIRLLVFTGARHGEILSLRWSEVNFERACLELTDSKTGEKDIFLPPAALQLLSGLTRAKGNPFVIVGSKPGRHLVNIKAPWGIIRREADLSDVRLHDLRHSFASFGARAGMSLPIIGALLGHRDTATTARYAHLSDDPLRSAADSIGTEIAEVMEADGNG